jgi:hypothetical protein
VVQSVGLLVGTGKEADLIGAIAGDIIGSVYEHAHHRSCPPPFRYFSQALGEVRVPPSPRFPPDSAMFSISTTRAKQKLAIRSINLDL